MPSDSETKESWIPRSPTRRFRRACAILSAGFAVCILSTPATAQQGTAGTGDTSPRAGKLTKAPELTNFKEVEAPYPEEEKASGRTAAVTLQLAISDRGD